MPTVRSNRPSVSLERVKEQLNYDPETGVFTWAVSRNGVKKGKRAGCTNPLGYREIRLDGRGYFEHRLAVFIMTGRWPQEVVDHADGDPGNNRWANLREATNSQNHANSRIDAKNVTGFKGVGWNKRKGKFVARIQVNKQKYFLGMFKTAEEAHAAYTAAAQEHFGEFARVA